MHFSQLLASSLFYLCSFSFACHRDEESCGSFFMRTLKTSGARRESYLAVQTLLSAEPFEVSFLAWLSFLKAAGGYAKLDDGVGGAQDAKTRGGMQQLSHTLLHIIQYHAAVFTLKEGVKEIQQTPKQGEVQVRLNAQVKKITRHGKFMWSTDIFKTKLTRSNFNLNSFCSSVISFTP